MYTRKGDDGETSLYGARRVKKDDPRIEAYGTIDELNSLLGVVIAESDEKTTTAPLKEIQRLLFVSGADMAAQKSERGVPRIAPSDTARLESMTDELLSKLPSLRNFILPGGSPTGARLQLARTVCRRAERRILTASSAEPINPELLRFFNRLSSYLFNLSRTANWAAGAKEDVWKG